MPEPQKPAPKPDEKLERFYLVPETLDEERVAIAWLSKHDHEALKEGEERYSNAIDINSLHRGQVVFALVRKQRLKKGLRPTQPITESPIDGARVSQHAEAEEFVDEIDVGDGVKPIDYWEAGANRFSHRLNKHDFYLALARQAHPWRLAYADAASYKTDDAHWLVLRSC